MALPWCASDISYYIPRSRAVIFPLENARNAQILPRSRSSASFHACRGYFLNSLCDGRVRKYDLSQQPAYYSTLHGTSQNSERDTASADVSDPTDFQSPSAVHLDEACCLRRRRGDGA